MSDRGYITGEVVVEEKEIETEKLPGNLDNLDKITVRTLKNSAVSNLENISEDFKGTKFEKWALHVIKEFGLYIDSFDPKKSGPEDLEAFNRLAQELGEDKRDQLYNEYRQDLLHLLSVTMAVSKGGRDYQHLLAFELVNAVSKHGASFNSARFVENFKDHIEEDKAEELAEAIESFAKANLRPFHEFVDGINDTNFSAELDSRSNSRKEKYSKLLSAFEPAFPSNNMRQVYEADRGGFKNWPEKVAEAKKARDIKDEYDTTKDDIFINTRKGFLGTREYRMRTQQYIDIREEFVEVVTRDDKGKITGRKMEKVWVPRCTFYTTQAQNKVKEGQATANPRDLWPKFEQAFDGRFDSITKIERFLDQLDAAVPTGNGKYKIPVVDKDGNPNWLIIYEADFNKLYSTMIKGRDSFERHGLTREKFAHEERQSFLEELSPKPTSWIEYNRCEAALNRELSAISEEMDAKGEKHLSDNISQAQKVIAEEYQSFIENYGRYSHYEKIAIERLTKRGLNPNSPEWKANFQLEVDKISVEYAYKSIVYKQIVPEIIAQSRAADTPEKKKKLAEYVSNLDYVIEAQWLVKYLAHINASENSDIKETETEVLNSFKPVLRRVVDRAEDKGRLAERQKLALDYSQHYSDALKHLVDELEHAKPETSNSNTEQLVKQLLHINSLQNSLNIADGQIKILVSSVVDSKFTKDQQKNIIEKREQAISSLRPNGTLRASEKQLMEEEAAESFARQGMSRVGTVFKLLNSATELNGAFGYPEGRARSIITRLKNTWSSESLVDIKNGDPNVKNALEEPLDFVSA